jgi:endonuclease/exonuclease/phosphatase (EEP) superfamily protein YafD
VPAGARLAALLTRRRTGGGRAGAAVVLGYAAVAGLGPLWAREAWAADLLTHFRPHLLALGLALVLLLRPPRAAGLAALALLAAAHLPHLAGSRAGAAAAQAGDGGAARRPLRVATANVMGDGGDPARLSAYARAVRPDLLVLQEVSVAWWPRLAALADILPHSTVAALPRQAVVVLSRLPIEGVEQLPPVPGAGPGTSPPVRATVRPGGGDPVQVYAVHLDTPRSPDRWRARNRALADLAARIAAGGPAPVVVAGDLNTAAWSPLFADFLAASGLADARGGRAPRPTRQPLPGVPALALLGSPVDHVAVSPAVATAGYAVGPDVGSDHLPVLVDLLLPPPGGRP